MLKDSAVTSQPVRIGVTATARIARTVIPRINACGNATVVAIAGRSPDKLAEFSRLYGIPRTFQTAAELFADPNIDAVYIPQPPALHEEWVCAAAAAGKHILCEKPLGCNLAEADRMIAACRNAGVVLLDGVMWYHTERARRVRDLAASELGTLTQITSAFTFPGSKLPATDFRYQDSAGGGCLLDLGWYCVGAANLIYGCQPERVFATAQWQGAVDVHVNGVLWYPENRMASFECGFNAVKRRWLEITGTAAALVCDDFTRPWNDDRPRFWIHDAEGGATQHVVSHPPQEECMINAFCQLVHERQTDHVWLQLSRKTQAACDALLLSARSEAVVAVHGG
ncbi:MAG: Gfo/Idh/MocA family oxidoreductase [Planctomycetaceae bacterium]|nr:Gfo/Idh/MocA family oxidoreductase [Planctomycetaceae bacterium]